MARVKPRTTSDPRTALLEWMDGLGLGLPPQPTGEMPTLPEDVTDLQDRELMGLFRELLAWHDYLSGLHAAVAVQGDDLNARAEEAESAAMVRFFDKHVAIAKAQAVATDAVQEARAEARKIDGRRRMLRTLTENMERDTAFVSREITRRTTRAPYENRDARSGGG